jgi:4-diphosphocytidyl-2-C-methyl-D-erythritol kinase
MRFASFHCPAKINLMLAVHGPRLDGFHELTSLLVALDFGDQLTVQPNEGTADRLFCESPQVPLGPENLILRAARSFREQTGIAIYCDFELDKQIPLGAGLGGGSSNAVSTLRALNELSGEPLGLSELEALAAGLGSDCPFFCSAKPAILRGRGDRVQPLSEAQAERLRGRRLILFKPDFSVSTSWAYGALKASGPAVYASSAFAAARLESFQGEGSWQGALYNTFEPVVGGKFLAIDCLLSEFRRRGVACLMSGSGSCCFALVDGAQVGELRRVCEEAWGAGSFFIETAII